MSEMMKRLARLPEGKREEFLALLRVDGHAGERSGPTRQPDAGPAPLSYAQETLWFLDRLAPGRATYNVSLCFRIHGHLDVVALRRALTGMIARHEALRTSLVEQEDGPVQVVAPTLPFDLAAIDVDDCGQAHELATEVARQPFDLGRSPLWRARLFRLAPDEFVFLFVVHHVVFDGWSTGVFARELAELYRAARAGEEPSLPPLALQYADYTRWQRDWLTGATLERLASFWQERLSGVGVLDLPTDRPRPAEVTFTGTFARHSLPLETLDRVRALGREEGISPYSVFVAAFFVLLQRYSGQDDLVLGSPTANRVQPEVEPLVGFFVNMLVLRADLSGDPTFRAAARRVAAVVRDAYEHGDLPFERLVHAVRPARDPSRSPLFQVAYTFQNAGAALELPGLQVEQWSLDLVTTRFDMSWNVSEGPDGVDLHVEFNTDLFDRETIQQMLSHYERLLDAVTAAPDEPVSRPALLTAAEQAALVERWNGIRRPVPRAVVPELFQRQVACTPDAVAVVAGGEERTYAEVNDRANRIADLLRQLGAGPGERVALCLPRCPDLVVAVLGVLKAGAAYVPLDPGHPPARLAVIIEDAAPVAIISQAALADRLPVDGPLVLGLDELGEDLARRSPNDLVTTVTPEDLAYVLYTSGSTGRPKGVLIEHHSVVNFVASVQELFELTPADRVLGFAAVTFDVSVFEMFSALLTGARLHLAGDDERFSLDRLQELMEQAGITVIDLPPPVMALLEPERLAALRIVFVGGEAFSGELVNRWNQGRRFYNGYGPTECTVTMIVHECAGRWTTSPPIGLPMANHVAHVVDRHLRPVPYGVAGELVVGGEGLARGYLQRPELEEQAFVPDPFETAAGHRLYRTGDLVKRRRDGALVFLGRIDQQVKIRGLRIELGEIEAVLARHPGVRQAVVEPWSDERGERRLVAYVTPRDGGAPPHAELRVHCAEQLPVSMVPAHFVALGSLPLTPSGKVDRRALPPPDLDGLVSTDEPRTSTEGIMVEEILGRVLGLPRVGIHDDFFELGGSSLQAAQLISRIRRRFDVEVDVADFFRDPTAAGLGAVVDRQRVSRADEDELLEILEAMSEEEADRLMRPGEGGDRA